MGTDIHMFAEKINTWPNEEQRKTGKVWEARAVPPYFTDRNYRLFAALGNVRNGYGFAGVPTHTPIHPISDNRGFPENMSRFGEIFKSMTEGSYNEDDWDEFEKNFGQLGFDSPGDHSTSYVTLRELKEYEWPRINATGWLTLDHYLKTVKVGENPNEWCGGVSGSNIVHLQPDEVDSLVIEEGKQYYVQCVWEDHLIDERIIKQILDWMEPLATPEWMADKTGVHPDDSVRLIFNFDS